jgi:hypothetical protein
MSKTDIASHQWTAYFITELHEHLSNTVDAKGFILYARYTLSDVDLKS